MLAGNNTTDTTDLDEVAQVKQYILQLLPDLSDETWSNFESKSVIRRYPKGYVVYPQGAVCNYVSFVCKGLIRSYYLVDGKEIITAFAYENCYFSEYESFLTRLPSKQYTDIIEDTTVVDIAYDDLQELYQKHPDCQKIGRLIAENLFVHLANKDSSYLMDTPEVRYINFLQEYESIVQRIPQYMIASYLGVTPEALSRIRSRISRKKAMTSIDQDQ